MGWGWFIANPKGAWARLVPWLVIVWLVREWVLMPVRISGTSMLPTFQDGQLALVNKLAYLLRSPGRGEVVTIWTGAELLVKRIVGLPGDDIEIRNGTVYVGGKLLRESYLKLNGHWTVAAGKLGAGRYVVLGDNRSMDSDQHMIAVVRKDRIVGKLMFVRIPGSAIDDREASKSVTGTFPFVKKSANISGQEAETCGK